ncbi:hypothetical protein D3C85_1389000 [compost metagenome]
MAQAAPASAQALPPINIEIHAAPGMSEQQLAQLVGQHVAKELARIQLANQAKSRSSLSDQD